MNSVVQLAFFALVLCAVIERSQAADKTCKQVLSEMTKRQMAGMSKCTKSMKFKNGKDKAKKTMCILRCVMMNEGILDAQGYVDKPAFEKILEENAPPDVKDNAMKIIGKCLDEHAAKIDPTEEFCKTYDPLIKCFMGSVMQLCPS